MNLGMKLAAGMQILISNAGEKARELKDHVSGKMDDATKQGDILKGRQIGVLVPRPLPDFRQLGDRVSQGFEN